MGPASRDNEQGNSTRSVHGGEDREKFAKSVTNPIAQTSTFVFDTLEEFEDYKAGKRANFEYGRYGNPTIRAAERKLAALEPCGRRPVVLLRNERDHVSASGDVAQRSASRHHGRIATAAQCSCAT